MPSTLGTWQDYRSCSLPAAQQTWCWRARPPSLAGAAIRGVRDSWGPESRGLAEHLRLVEKPSRGAEEDPEAGPGPIVTRTASGPALTLWQAVLAGDAGSVSHILADSSTGLAPDSVFDTSDPERWRDFRFNIRALRLWSLTYEEELTTPLHVAASRGHTEVLRLLLRRRARPDSAPGGRTALHEACVGGHTACVHVLLVAGADPNIPDQDGKRPLHLCQGPGILECAELLLRFGASVDGRSEEEEETPLHVAARLGHVELADLLLRRGACPDARDSEGWTPLLAACDTRCQSPADAEATTARCLQLCRLLLKAGADADAADRDKRRPLHLACRRGHAAVVLECWCTSPRTIEVLMNTYSGMQLPEEAMGLVPPETLQNHQRFYSSLFALVRKPRSLQHLSRCVLRSHLGSCLPHALPLLPLPPRLLRYLQLDFEDVLY
ncbi:ankyrin repeat and SOCS box protein 10 isoform X4 [Nycticebus coucang]|uniref:ankyrin repeat and SOCS box protein 10 isoform X4 n=1 Tax=Nycticebus coucang TaxID=9470 RepID=UPI00234C8CB8|nr:ankyrin repeat and SOCS box protein 10 isoform X4 [Nycticebus coucang]